MSPEPKNTLYACPCCGWWGLEYSAYDKLPEPPFGDLGQPPYIGRFGSASFQCCDCCGFEFGYDCEPAACGREVTFREYLLDWVKRGSHWFRPNQCPESWSLENQLAAAGLPQIARTN
jgi:hypothetical protein